MLMQMCLDRSPADIAMALGYDERARARALVDVIGSTLQRHTTPQADSVDQQQLNELHQDLHWLYQQLTERLMSEGAATPAFAALQQAVQDREARILELNRQHQIRSASMIDPSTPFDLAALQQQLGTTTVLVSYAILGDELIAFVVTDDRVEVVRQLATEPQIEDSVNRLRFQIDALRSNRQPNGPHAQQLLNRTQHHLRTLYRILIAPLEPLLGTRRLVVIPHGILHYLPFQALYTGDHYLIEQREICTAPSASVLQLCLDRPSQSHPQALLCGVPDTYAPHVRDEIAALADHFQQPVVLLDQQATSLALRQHAPTASIIHLACHATFRPDNPLFSALHLADGRFTTRDAYTLDLHCDLVVLSACETGVSHVAAGNEILGLARGFFAAGTPALIVSLWMVDDASTTQLMIQFYQRMLAGDSPAQALRTAQCQLLEQFPHPFFWAPFMLMGRW
jgi:CHAT domain-containing protein